MTTTYRDSGVDIDAGNELVRRLNRAFSSRPDKDSIGRTGGFAALSRVPTKYRNPVMALGTDGVGTKLELLIENDHLHTVGQDLVAMCANDLLVTGAEPSLFLDYFATGKLNVDEAETVINSIIQACEMAGCTLIGGETAEMPGFYPEDKFDLAGFCVGWVEEDQILNPERVQKGDAIIGVASSGPHSNGYSLIRKILRDLDSPPNAEILASLLEPTRIYSKSLLPFVHELHGMSHITGGGFKDNLPRSFPDNLCAHIDLNSWDRPFVFDWLQQCGVIEELELLATFNCGIGMVLFVDPDRAPAVFEHLELANETSFPLGYMTTLDDAPTPGALVVSKTQYEIAQ